MEFQTDCMQVVNGISREKDDVIISTVASDIRKLKSNFDECCFTFTGRVNNFVSHKLAKMAINLKESAKRTDDFLVWLLELAQADCKGSCSSLI